MAIAALPQNKKTPCHILPNIIHTHKAIPYSTLPSIKNYANKNNKKTDNNKYLEDEKMTGC